MTSLIKNLHATRQKKLFADLNYLNISEYQSFCKKHSLPFTITVETKNKMRKKTGDKDKKDIVLKRIKHYIKTGKTLPETCYLSRVVNYTKLKNPKSSDRLHYGQYDKKNKAMLTLLKKID